MARRRNPLTFMALVLALVLGASGVARATSPGELDPTFGSAGIVSAGPNSQLFGVAVRPNGETITVGQSSGLVLVQRMGASGQLEGQSVGRSGVARAVALQTDGKIVVAGGSGGMFGERFNADGSIDTSFAGGAARAAPLGSSAIANGVAIQPDGKVVVVGSTGAIDTRIALARFNTNGTLDHSFGSGGTEVVDLGLPYATAEGVAIQPDGKIVFVGREQGSTTYAFFNGLVVRLNINGSLDTSFDGSGVLSYHHPGGGYTEMNAVTLQGDGKIVAAGADAGGPNALFLRLNPDGSFDGNFGSHGVAALASGFATSTGDPIGAYGVGIGGGGRVLGAGNYEDTSTEVDATAMALTPGGVPEATFGSGGVVRAPTGYYEACALAIAPDGSLVSVGNIPTQTPDGTPCAVGSKSAAFVARYIGFGPPPVTSPGSPGSPGPPQSTVRPTVTTGLPAAITEVTVTLSGEINPGARSTTYHFDYGTSEAYGSSSATGSLDAGGSTVGVSERLRGLTPGTTYHYRLVATNADGTSYGAQRTFTTAPRLKIKLFGLKPFYRLGWVAKHGLALRLRCSQPCAIRAALLVTARIAKGLGLGRRQLTLGTGSTLLTHAGTTRLHLALGGRGKHEIARLHHLSVVLRILVVPSGGGPRVLTARTMELNR